MSPARKRKMRRPSMSNTLDHLNNISSIVQPKRRHSARGDSIFDIPSSPEPRRPRKSEPVQPLTEYRTRQNKSTPTPEAIEPTESDREPERSEEAEEDQLSRDVTDYEDAEELVIISGEEDGWEEQQLNSRSPQPEETEDTSGYWQDREEDDNGNGNQTLGNERNGNSVDEGGMSSQENNKSTGDMKSESSAEPSEHASPPKEPPNNQSSPQSGYSRRLVPSHHHIEVVIDNSEHSFLSHGYAETIHEGDDQDMGHQGQPPIDETPYERQVEPNIQFLRDLRHWFDREVKKTGVENDWKNLNEKGRALKQYAVRPQPSCMQYLHQLFVEYRRLYKEALEYEEYDELPVDIWTPFKNIKESIVTEVRQLFEHASETLHDPTVLDQFEAHFMPKMIILTQLGFKIYRISDGMSHDQLFQTLDLLSVCIGLVKAYVGLLNPIYRSRVLLQPLSRVMKALDTGQLRAHRTNANNSLWSDIPPVIDRWTLAEERVLRYGMIQYVEFDNPFLHIATQWGHKLPGRSMRDMEGKARQMGLI